MLIFKNDRRTSIRKFFLFLPSLNKEQSFFYYLVQSFFHIFIYLVFPDTNHFPPFFLQISVLLLVPLHVPFYFWYPVLLIGFRRPVASLAAVPEAAINEDAYLPRDHDDIRLKVKLLEPMVQAVPVAFLE